VLSKARVEKLKVDEFYQKVGNKLSVLKEICEKYKIKMSVKAYIGDDFNNLECIKATGFSACLVDVV